MSSACAVREAALSWTRRIATVWSVWHCTTRQTSEIRQRLEIRRPHLVLERRLGDDGHALADQCPYHVEEHMQGANRERVAGRGLNSAAAWTIPSLISSRQMAGQPIVGRADAPGLSCLSRPVRSPRPALGGPSPESSGCPGNASYRRAARISPTAAISASTDAPHAITLNVWHPASMYGARNSAMWHGDPAGTPLLEPLVRACRRRLPSPAPRTLGLRWTSSRRRTTR